jgi:NADH-quinone oxidoreductase subunit N
LLLVLISLGFKIAAFPMQVWAPDVYQGAPTPVAAFLAIGSKAAGFVLLLRVFLSVVPNITLGWEKLLMIMSALTILYGNLGAIPQRNLKRLLGYSSIANAGYLLLGLAALNHAGASAILYYLISYLFAVVAAFMVITLVIRQSGAEDISALAGLSLRSPLLAGSMTLAMISLAGIPPLAGFFGKFLLFKAVAERAVSWPAYYGLLAVAIVGVVISIWYYFGVIRTIYWSSPTGVPAPLNISLPGRISLSVCLLGLLYLGTLPSTPLLWATHAVKALKF